MRISTVKGVLLIFGKTVNKCNGMNWNKSFLPHIVISIQIAYNEGPIIKIMLYMFITFFIINII